MDKQRNYTTKQRLALIARDHVCVLCGADGSEDGPDGKANGLEADHILPWSKGGLTTMENGQILCRFHNNLKSNKNTEQVRVDYYKVEHFKEGTLLKKAKK